MKNKTISKYVFAGNEFGDAIIEIDSEENFCDLNEEATLLHELLYDNLPEETYKELVRLMKEVN